MERIGLNESEVRLRYRLAVAANAYWKAKDAALCDMGPQELADKKCRELQRLLARTGDSENFHMVVAAEWVVCIADLQHYQVTSQKNRGTFPQNTILSTLRAAVDGMKEINDNLMFRDQDAQRFHAYSSRTRLRKNEHDGAGLPKDAIRRLLSGHMTRLQNKAKGMDGTSDEEQNLVWYRHRNIQTAERLYKAMQREALGIDDKSKSQDRQR